MVEWYKWSWPDDWTLKYPILKGFKMPSLKCNDHDKTKWKDRNGNLTNFHSKAVWEAIYPHGNVVNWSKGRYGMSKKVAMQGGGVGEGLGRSLLAAASKEVTKGILSQEIIRCLQEGDGASMEHVVESPWCLVAKISFKNGSKCK
ncbi:hypothetical protein Tco_1500999 [Tanacetum coccineum]